MYVLETTKTIYVDVDDTLIFWTGTDTAVNTKFVKINGETFRCNLPLVEKLHILKAAGYKIIVWSQGGGDWARDVSEAIGITDLIEACLAKPMFYYDDLPVDKWIGKRIDPSAQLKPGVEISPKTL
jgi:predicted HAD superfamily phosphohydrolase YqeG